MGLDMYLTRQTYVKDWNHIPKKDKFKVSVKKGDKKYEGIDTKKISYIEEEVGYWRKANAIHNWFVRNVQGGEDDCGKHYVSHEQLRSLLDDVNEVLKSLKMVDGKIMNGYRFSKGKKTPILEDGKVIKNTTTAELILPTAEGFFFGGTGYDEWYVEELKETKKIIEDVLKDKTERSIYYQSSW